MRAVIRTAPRPGRRLFYDTTAAAMPDLGRALGLVIPGRREASNPESRDSRFASSMRPGMTLSRTKKRPASAGLFRRIALLSRDGDDEVMMVVVAARREPHRLQFDRGDAGRDVQPGLALQADRLQRVGIRRTADQEVAAAANSDRGVGADAAVIAGEIAIADPRGRRVHRPAQFGLIGDAEIEAKAADGCDIRLGPAAFALEHALQAGGRADDVADILAALALQDAGADGRHRVGAGERARERGDGNRKCRELH